MFPSNTDDTPRSGNVFQASHRPWSSIVSCGKELSSARTANKPTQQGSERNEVRSTRSLRHLPRQSCQKKTYSISFLPESLNQPTKFIFQRSGKWTLKLPNLNEKHLLELRYFLHLPPRSSEQRQSRSWFTNSIKEEAGRRNFRGPEKPKTVDPNKDLPSKKLRKGGWCVGTSTYKQAGNINFVLQVFLSVIIAAPPMTEEYPKARKRTHMSLSYLQCCHAKDETSHVQCLNSQQFIWHNKSVVFQDSHQADSSCRASEHQQSFHWNLDRVSGSLHQKLWHNRDLWINLQEMVPGDARWSPSKPQSHPARWFADKG